MGPRRESVGNVSRSGHCFQDDASPTCRFCYEQQLDGPDGERPFSPSSIASGFVVENAFLVLHGPCNHRDGYLITVWSSCQLQGI